MTEPKNEPAQEPSAADRAGAAGAPSEAPVSGFSPEVRDVIGRRGYDEGEDETATEDEQH